MKVNFILSFSLCFLIPFLKVTSLQLWRIDKMIIMFWFYFHFRNHFLTLCCNVHQFWCILVVFEYFFPIWVHTINITYDPFIFFGIVIFRKMSKIYFSFIKELRSSLTEPSRIESSLCSYVTQIQFYVYFKSLHAPLQRDFRWLVK